MKWIVTDKSIVGLTSSNAIILHLVVFLANNSRLLIALAFEKIKILSDLLMKQLNTPPQKKINKNLRNISPLIPSGSI